ncbi:MAG: TldD/PmbA family protein [Eubacteriales bacterium]|nr:TldD/PmbA family protein [Eubacteriales bacterium]
MISKQNCERALTRALSRGGTFAEIFYEDTRAFGMTLRSGKIENAALSRPCGAGIRIYDGLRSIYVYTCDTTLSGLLRAADRAAAAVSDTKGSGRDVILHERTFENRHPVAVSALSAPARARADILRAADAAARGVSGRITQVTAGLMAREQHVTIANSDGLFTSDVRTYTRLSCSAIASDGMENQTGTQNPGAMMGFELFDSRVDPAKVGEKAARTAVTMLDAPYCSAGEMPVVIAGGFGGVIFHEACGHSLEATSVEPGMSEFAGRLGEKIAAPCVTAIDDGTMENEWGSENIDDEGMPTTRLVLIENGVLKNYMIDRLNGLKMGMAPTGSGRRESYAYAPTSRMRNTFIAAGTDDEEEMLRTMGDGLYAAQMGGGSVNPATGEFNFAVQEGYLVKDGKITSPVRGASLIGKGSEILMRIDRVGREMTMGQGMCGSMSGSVPTNVGQPTIRVSRLTVGGK